MKTFHPAVKILTASIFFLLMFAFVAFRSGAFDGTRAAQIKLHVSRTGKSHHQKSNDPNKRAVHEGRPTLKQRASTIEINPEWAMMASSKTIVATPVHWSFVGNSFGSNASRAMMSSSKSTLMVSEAELYSVYRGIFNVPYSDKTVGKNEQLKQGKK